MGKWIPELKKYPDGYVRCAVNIDHDLNKRLENLAKKNKCSKSFYIYKYLKENIK